MEGISEIGTLAVTELVFSGSAPLLFLTANVVPISAILIILITEAIAFSEI
jgi:hypothetical protein